MEVQHEVEKLLIFMQAGSMQASSVGEGGNAVHMPTGASPMQTELREQPEQHDNSTWL